MAILRQSTLLLLSAAVTAFAGCGGSEKPATQAPVQSRVPGDERGVLQTIDALQTASRKGDGQTICADIFTPQLARAVRAAAKRSCAAEVREKLFSPDAELSIGRDIKVNGDQATAVVREQNGHVSKLFMLRRGDRWQIDRVRPQRA